MGNTAPLFLLPNLNAVDSILAPFGFECKAAVKDVLQLELYPPRLSEMKQLLRSNS